MEIAVQGNCLESGFVMGAVWGRNAQAVGRAGSARTDRRLQSTPMREHQKGLHEGTPCRPLIGWRVIAGYSERQPHIVLRQRSQRLL